MSIIKPKPIKKVIVLTLIGAILVAIFIVSISHFYSAKKPIKNIKTTHKK